MHRACKYIAFTHAIAASCAFSLPALADDGFQWATIGAVGNQAYQGPGVSTHGRGRVDYEYKISKLEITTAQWLEFTNTFSTQTDEYKFTNFGPTFWGATFDTRYTGPGVKYKLRNDPNAAMRPVAGISWRDAARYCNWLHNGKSSNLNSLITGAYDTTTFGYSSGPVFTDALTHLAGAKYWIPTLDEWMKAAYYDPHRYGNDVGGWWSQANMSDAPGISGVPGVGTTSADLELPDFGEWGIPLGAYPQSVSPWGLLDTSGGAQEWTEGAATSQNPTDRVVRGSYAGGSTGYDSIAFSYSSPPDGFFATEGLRICSAVPTPSVSSLGFAFVCTCASRRRERSHAR